MSHLLHSLLPNPRRSIEHITPDTSIDVCIQRMTNRDIGALVVMENDVLLGMVTERDIIRTCFGNGLDYRQVKAADILYKNIAILNEHDTVEKAMQVMTASKRRHVLFTEEGIITAIISIGDLLFYLLEDSDRVIEHLEKYIAGLD